MLFYRPPGDDGTIPAQPEASSFSATVQSKVPPGYPESEYQLASGAAMAIASPKTWMPHLEELVDEFLRVADHDVTATVLLRQCLDTITALTVERAQGFIIVWIGQSHHHLD